MLKKLNAATGSILASNFRRDPILPAQQTLGSINGTVTDASGAVVQGAKVSVKNLGHKPATGKRPPRVTAPSNSLIFLWVRTPLRSPGMDFRPKFTHTFRFEET